MKVSQEINSIGSWSTYLVELAEHGQPDVVGDVLRAFRNEVAGGIRLREKSWKKPGCEAIIDQSIDLAASCQLLGAEKLAFIVEELLRCNSHYETDRQVF
jgi:hypothetical protein